MTDNVKKLLYSLKFGIDFLLLLCYINLEKEKRRKMIKKLSYKKFLAVICGIPLVVFATGAVLMGVGESKLKKIKNGYEDREQFLEFCLKDNYLRGLYEKKVYPAQLQYMDGEISRKDLNNAIDVYIVEAKREYSFKDYTEVSGQAVEYEIGRNLSSAGSATMAVSMALGIGAGVTLAASAAKEEEEEEEKTL